MFKARSHAKLSTTISAIEPEPLSATSSPKKKTMHKTLNASALDLHNLLPTPKDLAFAVEDFKP
jgi:hypothetical protein